MSESAPRLPLWRVLRSAASLVWRASRPEVLVLLATQLISALALVAQLYLAREVLIEVTNEDEIDSFAVLGPVLVWLLVVRVIVSVSSTARSEVRDIANDKVRRVAARELYEVAAAAELAAFDDADFHDRLRRAHDNTSRRIWSTVWSLVALSSALVTLAAMVAVLVVVAPVVLAVAIVAAIPLWWVRRKDNQAEYRLAYEYTAEDRERSYLERLMVNREPAGELRSYGLGPTLIGRIDRLFALRVARITDLVKRRIWWSAGAAVISNAIAVGAIALLAQLIISDDLSVADGGVAILALQQAASRLASMSESVGSLSGAGLFLHDYEAFVGQSMPAAPTTPLRRDALRSVRLAGVDFTYPGTDRRVLHGIDLEVGRGELVALVGANGSGKSTVAKLIGGLYPPSGGSVVWETTEGTVDDRHRIRETVGLVFQDFLRFELTARDNVGFGDVSDPDPSDDRIWEALAAAGIDEVVRAEADGIDQRLGRSFADGAELSAGQWQRIGIARAFYRDAPLLVLDEPTAAVDARAEQELFDVVRSLQAGRGVVLITHRMATVRDAHRIYVLDRGRIVEVGDHDALLANEGTYAELYRAQASAYRDDPPDR
ncbi:MAG: ABC transporter ATP-binding protein [Actinomycetota bacterium]